MYEGVSEGVYSFMARTKDQVSPHSKLVRVTEGEDDRLLLRIEKGTELVVILLDKDGTQIPARVSVTDANGRSVNDLRSFGGAFAFMNGRGDTERSTRVGPRRSGSQPSPMRSAIATLV